MKAVVKYPGSKWSLADWIISFFPEHHSYLEPFFGSGAVLFNKPRSNIETVNDLDGNVVNLFNWIKKDPERLAHEIYYTPYARQIYEEAFNATVRHAIITGECGAQGHFAKNSRMKLPKKWLKLFGGYENQNENVCYGKPEPDIPISNECCYYLKEKPCDDWAKEHNSKPYLGLMASEGGQREEALVEHGCNYYGKTVVRSAPFAIFLRNDLLTLALDMDRYYQEHVEEFARLYYQQPYSRDKKGNLIPYEPVDSIIPSIYGEILERENGELYTTRAQRTGCSMCGFGIHLEQRPHRFDRLREENPKEWHYWMYECYTDKETGEKYGWGRVLDYIGVPWEDIPAVQMTMEEYLGMGG